MPRVNRYFLPGYNWRIVALARPWATRHKNMAQASLSTVPVSPPPGSKHTAATRKNSRSSLPKTVNAAHKHCVKPLFRADFPQADRQLQGVILIITV